MVNRVFGGTTSGSGGYTLRYHVAECPCQRSLRSPGPREDLRRCRSRDALTATHAPPSHVTLLGPMPAFMVVLINFGYRRRLSRLRRMNEAAIANNRNRRKTCCALRLAPKQSPPSIAPKGQTKLSISLDDFGALKFWFRIRTSPRPSDAKRVWEAGYWKCRAPGINAASPRSAHMPRGVRSKSA